MRGQNASEARQEPRSPCIERSYWGRFRTDWLWEALGGKLPFPFGSTGKVCPDRSRHQVSHSGWGCGEPCCSFNTCFFSAQAGRKETVGLRVLIEIAAARSTTP